MDPADARPIPAAGTVTTGGLRLPAVGFGTYRLTGFAGRAVVTQALRQGYRLLDSAFSYENEGVVGAAVRASGVPRESVVVVSKLPGRHHRADLATRAIEESVLRTGLDAIDLYLVHWPNPRLDLYVEAWQALVDARERGLVRHIGVCNFDVGHIDRLVAQTGVTPEVNQVERHPRFPQHDLVDHHRERGIVTMAWGPLGRGTDLLDHPAIVRVADRRGITPAQVVLAWQLAGGAVPIPKAASPGRQRENLAAAGVRLTPSDLVEVDALAQPRGRIDGQDPSTFEEL